MDKKRVLILGVGNTLLGDEGFGVWAVRYLEKAYAWPDNIRLLDGGTSGLMLMADLLECDLAIILDIARLGQPPGTFYQIAGQDFGAALNSERSAHQTSVEDLLISCALAGQRPESVIFAMEPFDCANLAVQPTPGARQRLPEFCARVARELNKIGIDCGPQKINTDFWD